MILLDTDIDKKLNTDYFQGKSGPKYRAFCLPKIVDALADSKTEVTLVQNQCSHCILREGLICHLTAFLENTSQPGFICSIV